MIDIKKLEKLEIEKKLYEYEYLKKLLVEKQKIERDINELIF